MGDLIAPLIGGVGSLIGGQAQDKASDAATKLANKGFKYLKDSPLGTEYLPAGGRATSTTEALLGLGGDPKAGADAFNNYLNSTGYQFQLNQGQQAVTTNNASKGLLNSGATIKALARYGQGLGGQYFQSYLNNLQGLSQGGLNAGAAIGNAASAAGTNQANIATQRGDNQAGTYGALSGFGSSLASGLFKPSTSPLNSIQQKILNG